jgi:hypothetical protein
MLNFPNAPIDGELSQQPNGVIYEWQAAKTRWITPIALDPESAAGVVVQVQEFQRGDVVVCAAMPYTDSIPQITDGTECLSVGITPKFATSLLRIDCTGFFSTNDGLFCTGAIFKDSTADAIAAVAFYCLSNEAQVVSVTHFIAAGSTAAQVFSARFGPNVAAGLWLNADGAGTRLYGGVASANITITEIRQ